MRTGLINSITEVEASLWQQLWATDYPFIQHDFMALLEDSKCVGGRSGWTPRHILIWQEDRLVAAMPGFIKTHSYGEYVFDWSWADAYGRHGLEYYPKWINAMPFTPATGPRLAIAPGADGAAVMQALNEAWQELLKQGAHSLHSLFPDNASLPRLPAAWHTRWGCQYHWFNNGFRDWQDFLAQCNSRKRKMMVKERQKVQALNLTIAVKSGTELTGEDWQAFYGLYQNTYAKRSGRPGYLTQDFFTGLQAILPGQIHRVDVSRSGQLIAAALYFSDGETLYGRYWGCSEEHDGLHFEACYYQGIELAIKLGLKRFDPGAQGEHKIARGFTPVLTCSKHLLAHAGFHEAVGEFCREEQMGIERYIQSARQALPFKEGYVCVEPGILQKNKSEIIY
ncbi:MAG TPA: GNAT family N-acetyltransferase [Cellvibrionaceae bacterium]|nr:GNAT family N-acetyltransferase [Cellvibrionaceae bacterium]